MDHYDVCIIGGGPSGYAAAMRAVDFRKKVLLVEKNKLAAAASSPGSGGAVNYQPLLDEHILDCLELAVLSCEIFNLCEKQSTKQ